MKVTVFNGSPAGCNSATNVIAGAFLKGAISAGVHWKIKKQNYPDILVINFK